MDQSPVSIAKVHILVGTLAPTLPLTHFRVEPVEQTSFEDANFDVVISSAVLHFAKTEKHWRSMVDEMWRVLKPGGLLFARLASSIGIEGKITPIEGRRYRLPDGTDRFLVDEEMLMRTSQSLDGEWAEPLKTVVVQDIRSMSNWCLRKSL